MKMLMLNEETYDYFGFLASIQNFDKSGKSDN